MRPWPARRSIAAAAVTGLLALTGCGDEERLDSSAIEQEIRQGLQRQTGVAIGEVECPEDVEPERGDTFECTATYAGGGQASIRVRQQDSDGNVVWRLAPK